MQNTRFNRLYFYTFFYIILWQNDIKLYAYIALEKGEMKMRKNRDSQYTHSKFELPNLNKFIYENMQNRERSTDYNLLYRISKIMSNELKIKDRHINEITKPISEKQTKEVTLQFFKELDQELYEKAKKIIDGNSDIGFNMYMLDGNEDFSKTKSDGMPVHTRIPCVFSRNGKSAVYMPYKGTIEDIYLLVHELSHTFDLMPNDNPTRNMLGEVTPYCFEAMLSQYLLKNGITSKKDIVNREKGNSISQYDDGVETFAKLELMRVKEKQGNITQENITEMQKKYGISNRQLSYILRRLAQSEPNIDCKARYMIAQLIYPHYMEQYQQNPAKAIKTLKEYFEQIKLNKFEDSLKVLGINPSIDSIQVLIETTNRRIKRLENTRMFDDKEMSL